MMNDLKQDSLKIFVLLIGTLLISSCKKQPKSYIHDFGCFQMRIPNSWKAKQLQGIDSRVDIIVTENNDTINVDCGAYSNSFDDTVPVRPIEIKKRYDSTGFKYSDNMVFSETPEIDQDQGLYLKEYYYYDTIDNKRVKLGFPKKVGNGLCLIHFPKIDSSANSLSLYVSNVDSLTQMEIYRAFLSIKIK